MDWVRAHRKGIVAAITAVLVLVVDSETADRVGAAVGALLVYLVPNE